MSEINCHNCHGACCKGPQTMELTAKEAAFMRRGGTKLFTVAYPDPDAQPGVLYPLEYDLDAEALAVIEMRGYPDVVPAGKGRFVMLGRCAYLQTDEDGWEHCGVYDSRPAVCQAFEVGGPGCIAMREAPALDQYQAIELQSRSKPGPLT